MTAAAAIPSQPQRAREAAERRQWYLGAEGERRGPYAFIEIVALAGADRVAAEDLIWRPGFREWVPADSIAGLLSPPPIPSMQPDRAPRPVPATLPALKDASPQAAQPRPSSDWEWARAAVTAIDASVPEGEAAEAQPPETAPHAAQAEEAMSDAVGDTLPDAVPVEEEHHRPVATAPAPVAATPAPAVETHDGPNSETERLRSLVGGLASQSIEPKRSYLARHWHGELSFTRSLLVNGVLLTAAIGGAYEAVALWGPDVAALAKPALTHSGVDLARWSALWDAAPLWVVASARLVPWFAAGGIYLWSIVGIARAARKRG